MRCHFAAPDRRSNDFHPETGASPPPEGGTTGESRPGVCCKGRIRAHRRGWLQSIVVGIAVVVATLQPTRAAPPTPSLSSPANGATISGTSVTLVWNAASGAGAYSVGLRDQNTGSLVFIPLVTSTSYTVSVTPGHAYVWDVASCTSAGGGDNTSNCPNRSANRSFSVQGGTEIPLADGFDYPIGARIRYTAANDGDGWYVATEFNEHVPEVGKYHLGEDWNAETGGNSDLNAPIYAVANGTIVFAGPAATSGWGNVVIIRHRLADGTLVESLYGHVNSFVRTSGDVVRGEQVATIGDGGGLYYAHLHLEIRFSNCPYWGREGAGYSTSPSPVGWTDPSSFIDAHRPGTTSSDLVPQNVVPSQTVMMPGASLTVAWSLANAGPAAANATSTTAVRINQSTSSATGTNVAAVTTPALAAGASVSQSASLVAPTVPGTYYVWVIANSTGTVTNQSNTANDQQRSSAIIVQGTSSATARRDFDADGRSDVLWRRDDGLLMMWLLNGAQLRAAGSQGSVATSWRIVGLGDFDGDGKTDVLWRSDGGTLVMWLMNGTQIKAAASQGTVATDWKVAGVGDFDGDGKTDVLWRHIGGTVAMWLMNGTQVRAGGGIGAVPVDWTLVAVGDFDGDRKSDVMWRHTGGTVMTWLMNGMQMRAAGSQGSVPGVWKIVATGDIDGDGRSDIVWRHDGGTVVMWLLNGTQIKAAGSQGVVPTAWQVAGAGDYDGDGKTDVLWRNDVGTTVMWLLNGTQIKAAGGVGVVPASWRFQDNVTP